MYLLSHLQILNINVLFSFTFTAFRLKWSVVHSDFLYIGTDRLDHHSAPFVPFQAVSPLLEMCVHPGGSLFNQYVQYCQFSSPRSKRAGPMGLRAESTRALTGSQCPHSGEGEDFWRVGQFFTKLAVTRKWKVEKSMPGKEKNRSLTKFGVL